MMSQKRHILPLFSGLTLFLAFAVHLAALAGPEADLAVWVFLRANQTHQQARPPPLPDRYATSTDGLAAADTFEIKGMVTKRFHPFAKQFGKLVRGEMSRLYNEDKDPDQTHAKSVCGR